MKKIIVQLTLATSVVLISGCSMNNPFGIGYDKSVCNDSKTFGACGSPVNIYKYKDKITEVQNKYLEARLDTVLYFAVNDDGIVQVKADRDGPWERYDTSKWSKLIDQHIKKENERVLKEKGDIKEDNAPKVTSAWNGNVYSDLPVTKGGDLSIQYKEQGPLIRTKTSIGNIVRDQGLIQKIFMSNYVDDDGDLISSHEVLVVVKDPEWIVGEKNPKDVEIESFPTPMSASLLRNESISNVKESGVVSSFVKDKNEGFLKSQELIKENQSELNDSNLIKTFLSK